MVKNTVTGAVKYTKFMSRPDVCTGLSYVQSWRRYCPDVCTVTADVACLAVTG